MRAFKSIEMIQTRAEEIDDLLLSDDVEDILVEMGFDTKNIYAMWEPFMNIMTRIANKAQNQVYLSENP